MARMEAWICHHADLVLTNSQFIRRELAEAYEVPDERLSVVGCGVNPADFQTDADLRLFRHVFGVPDVPHIVFVGRLAHIKGPHLLLEAAPHVLKLYSAARFVFAGDGQMREGLEQRARDMGIAGNVEFVGHLRGKVLATLYHAADMVVVPSLYEPFGMVALEAMACGTPVVASDTGGLREIMAAGDCALPAPPNDPAALARAILHLLRERDRARELSETGRRVATERYRWADVARRTMRAYERAVA